MLDKTSVSARLLDLARSVAPALADRLDDPCSVDLREAGMTSVAAVRLMLEVEAAFDLAIPDADLTPENFATVATIETLVRRLKGLAAA